ncbi:hypothetical protein PPACK8108_LOCUS23230 [Phakopsora pachyrhizi]|uniref:Oxysterol-binding protein n=1 Tax=Phakopsora pachyrhizi TaxID=170000 RepID=A0AAV0BLT8_PHAPC|nr:hypothetical protein PPACK8108_LOCUS23230 [Phakopsora pachyrhizi]
MMSVFSSVTSRAGPKEHSSQEEDEEVLDEEPRNILLSLISQLRIGMDLHKVTLPTFVLEPRSMLERITDFLSHPDLIFGASRHEDPTERFIQALRYYLAGWHIKPKGVKKPYNPILGEIFRCRYDYPDGSQGFYVAEQVSHHPPVSAFYYASPDNQIEIWGDLRPKSKFLGNSAATIMEGTSKLLFGDRKEDGVYKITMPNMYARGILFGKMILELGDESKVQNETNQIFCDVEFKTKGFFGGEYNAIGGKVRDKSGVVGEIFGKWNEVMELRRTKGKTELMFDASKAQVTQKTVLPESEQDWNESRRLWSRVTRAIKKKDLDLATEAKTAIEDFQRDRAREREEKGERWEPVFFKLVDEEWKPKFELPDDCKEGTDLISKFIFDHHTSKPTSATFDLIKEIDRRESYGGNSSNSNSPTTATNVNSENNRNNSNHGTKKADQLRRKSSSLSSPGIDVVGIDKRDSSTFQQIS